MGIWWEWGWEEAVPSTGMGVGEAVPTMGRGIREAVPTTEMGSKWDGGMLDRPLWKKVVVKFIVTWEGWDWGAPNSRRD